MKQFLIRVAWFIGIPMVGGLLIMGSGIQESLFTDPVKYPTIQNVIGGILLYCGLSMDIAFIVTVWVKAIKGHD